MDDRLPGKRFSFWERRTKTKKCLLVFSGFCVVVIIYLASNLLMTFPPTRESLHQDVCMTEKCIRSAAGILEKIDQTVDPCDDFYEFACGKFLKDSVIPEADLSVSPMSKYSDKISLQMMSYFEEPIQENDPRSFKLVKTIFNSCMNKSKNDQETLNLVKSELKNLGGWPVLAPNWNEKMFDWINVQYRLRRIGFTDEFFIIMDIKSDLKNSSKHILTITQPYLPFDKSHKRYNDYPVWPFYQYAVEVAVLFGADKSTAVSDMKDVVEFMLELAHLIIPYEQRKNTSLEYNLFTIRELQDNFTSFSWLKLINNYLAPMNMLSSDDVVNVRLPKYFENLDAFLPKVEKRTIANYMLLATVFSSIDYLPDEFILKELNYLRVANGKNQITPLWETCVSQAKRLNIAVSSHHIKHLFNKNTNAKARELTEDIKLSFLETLKKIDWMDQKTKRHAILKAEKMGSWIGYPDEILDEGKVEEYYEGLELQPDLLLKLSFNISNFFYMKHVQKLRQPVLKPNWKYQAYTYVVNAYYLQSDNLIELPAGILQDPFFDPDRPQYLNYGSIGEVIGHEFTHGFDDEGRQFDKDGNLIDWWESETNQTFTNKSQCLVEQYSGYTLPDIGMSLNGVRNLAENIADNGGIKIAYRGYLKWLERNKPELRLPGLPYTPRQLFWISAGTTWCTKYKKEALKQMVLLGHHAPSYFRVVVPFMNSDHFGRDFNCPLGSPMNPKYKCRVW